MTWIAQIPISALNISIISSENIFEIDLRATNFGATGGILDWDSMQIPTFLVGF